MAKKIVPSHPGRLLLNEMLEPLGLTQYRLAKAINVPARRINEIVHGKRAVTADTSIRLGRFFGQSDNFWLTLQVKYDVAKAQDQLSGSLKEIRTYKDLENGNSC